MDPFPGILVQTGKTPYLCASTVERSSDIQGRPRSARRSGTSSAVFSVCLLFPSCSVLPGIHSLMAVIRSSPAWGLESPDLLFLGYCNLRCMSDILGSGNPSWLVHRACTENNDAGFEHDPAGWAIALSLLPSSVCLSRRDAPTGAPCARPKFDSNSPAMQCRSMMV